MDRYGKVKSAKLQSAAGITDEEVIDACKKAALLVKLGLVAQSHPALLG